jgi:hypothetical protein
MHAEYGTAEGHTCRDCCNLLRREWGARYFKCAAYSLSLATSSDWRLKYPACGLYGRDFDELGLKPLIEALKHRPRKKTEALAGQVGIEEVRADE